VHIRLSKLSQLLVSHDGLLGGKYSFDLATLPSLLSYAVPAATGFINALLVKGERALATATLNMLFRYCWGSLKGRYLVVERRTGRAVRVMARPQQMTPRDGWRPLCEKLSEQGATFIEGGSRDDEVYARYRLPEPAGYVVADGQEYTHYPGWHVLGWLVRPKPAATLPLVARNDGLSFVVRGRRPSGKYGPPGRDASPFADVTDYEGIVRKLQEAAQRPLGLSTIGMIRQLRQLMCSVYAFREGLRKAVARGADVFSMSTEGALRASFDQRQVITASSYACLCQVAHAARNVKLRWRENTEAVMLGWIRFGKCLMASEMS